MEKVPVEESVGMILAHDITKIIPKEFKGIAYRKGHVIREEDIEPLKNIGKNHIYIYKIDQDKCHENLGATRLAKAVAGENIILTEAAEGKVNLVSGIRGKLSINVEELKKFNFKDGIILATRHKDIVVNKGERVAGAKVIPLVIDQAIIEEVESRYEAQGSIINIVPFKPLKVGIIVTGSEVYYGRIKDAFAPVLQGKIKEYGGSVLEKVFVPDDFEQIEAEVRRLLDKGCDCIMVSGGMSVDPDDLTPAVLREVATEVITYGSPVLPGAMFMMAYYHKIPLLGVPACGMFSKVTVLDLMLPYVFAGEKITKEMVVNKAHGGLCLQCEVCVYPHCEFGKG